MGRRAFARDAARLSILAAALVAVAILAVRFARDPLARLDERRVIEARLSPLPHAPLRVTRSSGLSTSSREARVLAELTEALRESRSTENLHRLGVALLATGKLREARALLEEACRRAANDPSIVADLAAADLALGRVADAAEGAARALALDGDHVPAAFNWALALQKLANRPGAIEAWERYLRIDPESSWAEEAQSHLRELRADRPAYEEERHALRGGTDRATIERLVHRYPKRARARGHNVLLPEWIESGRGDVLAALRAMGEVRASMGDDYLLDIAKHAESVAGLPDRRSQLASGVRAYSAARDSEAAKRWDEAATGFANAADLLAAAGSPLGFGADVAAASADLSAGRLAEAIARAEEVERALVRTGRRYSCVEAEAAWVRGLGLARGGESDAALEAYRKARAAARRSGEIENEISIDELIASRMAAVAEPEDADRLRLDVLRRLDEIGAEPRAMMAGYQEMAFTSLRAGRPHVAAAFAAAALELARATGDRTSAAAALVRRALALHGIERHADAPLALAEARTTAMQIESEGERDRVLAEIDFTSGVMNGAQPDAARRAYTSALAIWERYGWRTHIVAGLFARGQAALAAGDAAGAEADFRAAIERMERDRSRLAEPVMRIAYFERGDALFDRLIALLVDRGRAAEALEVSERKRARFLLDQLSLEDGRAMPLTAAEIAGGTPAGTAILEIAPLERGTELWLVRGGRIVHARSAATRGQIESAVQRHLDAVREGDERQLRQSGAWLFAQLVGPVVPHLQPDEKLVIVGDAALQSFPYATLVTPEGKYLIERWTPLSAPSATIFLRPRAAAAPPTLLAVAQPSPEGFAPLSHAEREARDIARSHPRSRYYRGEAITPEDFLSSAADAGCVHYTGHAVADEERPSRSSLVFESTAGVAHLTAETIGRSRLRSQPFVVLAACSTARGKSRRTEGVESLAAAFLQAGARGVLATLWDIEDAPSARLFRRFHESLRAGAAPEDALRATQRAFLDAARPEDRNPAVWASVTLIAAE